MGLSVPAGKRTVLPGGGPVQGAEPQGRLVVCAEDRQQRPCPGQRAGSGELPGTGRVHPDATVSFGASFPEEPVSGTSRTADHLSHQGHNIIHYTESSGLGNVLKKDQFWF